MSLEQAIADLGKAPKVNIKGKQYTAVQARMEVFRRHFPDHALLTDVLKSDDGYIRVRAVISRVDDKDLVPVASGLAEEDRSAGMINQTAALENCETSAIGRALANFGLHGGEYASANEMEKALAKQEAIKGGVHPNDMSGADKLVTSKGVTALKQKARAMSADLANVEDIDSLDGFLTGYAPLMNDLKKHLPDWHQAALDAVKGKRESLQPLGV